MRREDAEVLRLFFDAIARPELPIDVGSAALKMARTPYGVLHRLFTLLKRMAPAAMPDSIDVQVLSVSERRCSFSVDLSRVPNINAIADFIEDHAPLLPIEKENQMPIDTPTAKPAGTDDSVPFEVVTTTYVFGRNVEKVSDDYLIEALRRIEEQIAVLKLIKTDSKAVIKRIVGLETAAKRIAELLDARVA